MSGECAEENFDEKKERLAPARGFVCGMGIGVAFWIVGIYLAKDIIMDFLQWAWGK